MRTKPTPPANAQTRPWDTPRRTLICVVDTVSGEYDTWAKSALAAGVEVHCFSSATEALRFTRGRSVDLWVVNEKLPGLSGLELCSMLKSQSSRTAVCLVCDEYTGESEQAAWAHRATFFVAKPAHRVVLDQWLTRRTGQPAARSPALCPTQ